MLSRRIFWFLLAFPGIRAAVPEDPGRRECAKAAADVLGPTAEIVKYGRYVDADHLDAVAVTRLRPLKATRTRVLITGLALLRFTRGTWKPVLAVSKSITNDAGYIRVDYIDDSYRFCGYELELKEGGASGTPAFALLLTYLTRSLGRDGIPIEIRYNPAVGRFQEFAPNEEPGGFKAEIKNPPHRRIRN